jgi:hypothetical protein
MALRGARLAGPQRNNYRSYKTVPFRTSKAHAKWMLTGQTRDSSDVAVPNAEVHLFTTGDDRLVEEMFSDGSGNFIFTQIPGNGIYYIVGYKVGTPDIAGTTINTLTPTEV